MPPTNECDKLAKCPVWNKFNTNSKMVWIKSYCQGEKQSQCARKQWPQANSTPTPDDLLPNSTYLSTGINTSECTNLVDCPIWAKFNTNSKMVWIKSYCQSEKQSQCARKQWSSKHDSPTPQHLLPNGTYLEN